MVRFTGNVRVVWNIDRLCSFSFHLLLKPDGFERKKVQWWLADILSCAKCSWRHLVLAKRSLISNPMLKYPLIHLVHAKRSLIFGRYVVLSKTSMGIFGPHWPIHLTPCTMPAILLRQGGLLLATLPQHNCRTNKTWWWFLCINHIHQKHKCYMLFELREVFLRVDVFDSRFSNNIVCSMLFLYNIAEKILISHWGHCLSGVWRFSPRLHGFFSRESSFLPLPKCVHVRWNVTSESFQLSDVRWVWVTLEEHPLQGGFDLAPELPGQALTSQGPQLE